MRPAATPPTIPFLSSLFASLALAALMMIASSLVEHRRAVEAAEQGRLCAEAALQAETLKLELERLQRELDKTTVEGFLSRPRLIGDFPTLDGR
jgi:hypothetical protein